MTLPLHYDGDYPKDKDLYYWYSDGATGLSRLPSKIHDIIHELILAATTTTSATTTTLRTVIKSFPVRIAFFSVSQIYWFTPEYLAFGAFLFNWHKGQYSLRV